MEVKGRWIQRIVQSKKIPENGSNTAVFPPLDKLHDSEGW